MLSLRPVKVYLHVFYNTFLTILAYPYELLITVIEPALEIGFLTLFWSIVAKAGGRPVDLANIVAYFVLVEFVAIWTLNPAGLNFASYIGWRIKNGQLSQTLVRPVQTLRTLLFENRGYYGVDMIFSVLLFAIAIKLSGGTSLYQVCWFVIFLILSFCITLSICILLGSLAFVTKEINSLRHSISHLIKIFAGALVPLSFFPEKIHHYLSYTPFPSMTYAPINNLQHRQPLSSVLFDLRVALLWAIVLLIIARLVWKYNLKKYEATGL